MSCSRAGEAGKSEHAVNAVILGGERAQTPLHGHTFVLLGGLLGFPEPQPLSLLVG